MAAPRAPARGIVDLQATATTTAGRVAWVDFAVDGAVVGSATTAPYDLPWNAAGVTAGRHTLTAVAHGTDGTTAASHATTVVTDATPAYTVDAGAYPSLNSYYYVQSYAGNFSTSHGNLSHHVLRVWVEAIQKVLE